MPAKLYINLLVDFVKNVKNIEISTVWFLNKARLFYFILRSVFWATWIGCEGR